MPAVNAWVAAQGADPVLLLKLLGVLAIATFAYWRGYRVGLKHGREIERERRVW